MGSELVPNLVSIIIPTYNRADLVVRAVRSALAQTHPLKQIIVVDDGSSDHTAAQVGTLAQVEYFHQENQGQPAARNLGLTQARGEFVASLDSDDFWNPTFLADSVRCLANTGAGFSFANWEIQGPTVTSNYASQLHKLAYLEPFADLVSDGWIHLNARQTRDLFMRHCPAPSASTVIRRSLIQHGWNASARISDDRLLLLDAIVEFGISSAFTFDRLWTKWLDGSNICDRQTDKIKLAQNEIHDRHVILERFENIMTVEERKLLRAAIARSYSDFAYHQYLAGNRTQAAAGYFRSFRNRPAIQPLLGLAKLLMKTKS